MAEADNYQLCHLSVVLGRQKVVFVFLRSDATFTWNTVDGSGITAEGERYDDQTKQA